VTVVLGGGGSMLFHCINTTNHPLDKVSASSASISKLPDKFVDILHLLESDPSHNLRNAAS